MKPEQVQKFEEIDYQGINYRSGKPTENPRSGRLKFLDFIKISQPVAVVLEDSPVLYSYIMWMHNKINPQAGVGTTIRDVSKK